MKTNFRSIFTVGLFLAIGLSSLSLGQETNTVPVAPSDAPAAPTPQPSEEDLLAKRVLPFQADDETEKQLNADFADIKIKGKKVRSHVTGDNRYLLYGDLFHNGGIYALAQLPFTDPNTDSTGDETPSVGLTALAQLVKGRWQTRGLWKIGVTWLSKDWANKPDSDLFQTPPKEPFEFVDFAGDGVPEILFAGEPGRYFHCYYLLRFDANTNGLQLLQETGHKPSGGKGYMIEGAGSGRRANTFETVYLKWEKEKFMVKAVSRDVKRDDDVTYTRITIKREQGDDEIFKVGSLDDKPNSITVTQDDKTYAVVTFDLTKPELDPEVDKEALKGQWIFEHLTGLSPEFPHRFEEYGTVTVKGSEEALQRLHSKQTNKA